MRTFKNLNNLTNSSEIIELLKKTATPMDNRADLDPLMNYIGDAKYHLKDDASHQTHAYYTQSAKITQRLLQKKGSSYAGVKGDWLDSRRLNRFTKGNLNSGTDVYTVLNEFKRWTTWKWANWEITVFIDWLKDYKIDLPSDKRIGFYGLEVCSFRESMNSIIHYLKKK